jgi:hypothetical protein
MPADDTFLIQKFKLTPERAKSFARLTWDHGDGYRPSALVGHSQGTIETYVLDLFLPDRAGDSRFLITDDGDANTVKTYKKYFLDFFTRRMVDGAPFKVYDQDTGAVSSGYWVFVDSQAQLQAAGKNFWVCQVRVKQWRDVDD